MDIGYKRDAQRQQAAALAMPLLGDEEKTQMRRMLKEAPCAVAGRVAAIQTPYGGEIRSQKLGRGI